MALTDEQFVEVVSEALEKHISRDETVAPEDVSWENWNFARALANALRVNGINAPRVEGWKG